MRSIGTVPILAPLLGLEVPMLLELFPRVHRRYTSLPVLGAILDRYGTWLLTQGYSSDRVREHFRAVRRLAKLLVQGGVRRLRELTRARLRAYAPAHSQDDPDVAVVVRLLERYVESETSLYRPRAQSRVEQRVAAYATHLEDVRGFASSTVHQHCSTIAEFLTHLRYEADPARLAVLTPNDIEAFVRRVGPRLARVSLQHVIAHLRAFLRFLAATGEAPVGLDTHIDTPRVYRGEQLPHALPWETVSAFLRAIDRSSRCGLRDYAIFLLMTTYGLRASEIVTLTLDDLEWRARRIRLAQRKTRGALWLPLTDEVATALVAYLRRARPLAAARRRPLRFQGHPAVARREVFLRCRTPAGVLKPTAITEAFQAWSRRSGLPIPFQGAHCLRHSYAVHLLRSGLSLKTIGDLLGHRTLESTCVYLRLAVDDLRDVALSLPGAAGQAPRTEVVP